MCRFSLDWQRPLTALLVFYECIRGLSIFCLWYEALFLSSFQKNSGIHLESSFNHDSKYVIKNVVSPIPKKVGNSYSQKSRKFRALGKISEWERMETLTMGQNTEVRKRPRITFLKNDCPLCIWEKNLLNIL